MSAKRIKFELLRDWLDTPARALAVELIDFIAGLPPSNTAMLTHRSLANAVQRSISDAQLHAAIAMLSASPIAALDVHALFIDEDGEEFELSDDEINQARSGNFVHPNSGDVIRNAYERIVPYFVPSNRFRESS